MAMRDLFQTKALGGGAEMSGLQGMFAEGGHQSTQNAVSGPTAVSEAMSDAGLSAGHGLGSSLFDSVAQLLGADKGAAKMLAQTGLATAAFSSAAQNNAKPQTVLAQQSKHLQAETLKPVRAVNKNLNFDIPSHARANNYALESTNTKLAQAQTMQKDLKQFEAAHHINMAGGSPRSDVSVAGIAKNMAFGTALAGAATMALGPVAGMVAAATLAGSDFMRATGHIMGSGSIAAPQGGGSSPVMSSRLSRSEMRRMVLQSEGSSPVRHSFSAIAQAQSATPATAGRAALASASLQGIGKLSAKDLKDYSVMNQNVKKAQETLGLQNGRAQTLEAGFNHRRQKGFELDGDNLSRAVNRGMDVVTSQGRLALNGLVA
jgi:hypothetical protein